MTHAGLRTRAFTSNMLCTEKN